MEKVHVQQGMAWQAGTDGVYDMTGRRGRRQGWWQARKRKRQKTGRHRQAGGKMVAKVQCRRDVHSRAQDAAEKAKVKLWHRDRSPPVLLHLLPNSPRKCSSSSFLFLPAFLPVCLSGAVTTKAHSSRSA